MSKEKAYIIFILVRDYRFDFEPYENDYAFDFYSEIADAFLESKYNNPNKDLISCLEDFTGVIDRIVSKIL